MPPPNTASSTSSAPPTRGDEDPQSPTVMLQAYLRSRGMPLTSQNMQRVLMENARGSADIPGLVNAEPSSDPSVGQGGNVAGKIEKAPTTSGRGYVDSGSFDVPDTTGKGPPASTNPPPAASPPPTSGGMDMRIPLGSAILGGTMLGAGGLMGRYLNRNYTTGAPQPGGSVGPMPDPATGVTTGDPAADARLFPPGSAQNQVQVGDRFATQPPPDPLQEALAKAVQPNMQPSAVGPSSPLTSPDPRATPPMSDINIPPPPVPTAPPTAAVPPRPPLPNVTTEVLPRPPMPNRVGVPRAPTPVPRAIIKGLHLF